MIKIKNVYWVSGWILIRTITSTKILLLDIWTILDDLKLERRLKCQFSLDIMDVDTLENLTSFHPNFNSSSGAALTIRGASTPHACSVWHINTILLTTYCHYYQTAEFSSQFVSRTNLLLLDVIKQCPHIRLQCWTICTSHHVLLYN